MHRCLNNNRNIYIYINIKYLFLFCIFLVNSSSQIFSKKCLVFDGIDTISEIYLNENLIGSTNNMFVKYTFSVEEYINVCGTFFFNYLNNL